MNPLIFRTLFLLHFSLLTCCTKTPPDNDDNTQAVNCTNGGRTILAEPRLATYLGSPLTGGDGVHCYAQSDGNYIVTVQTINGEGFWGGPGYKGAEDILLVKLDSNFNVIWKKYLGGSKKENNIRVKPLTNGNIWVVCDSDSNDGDIGNVGGRRGTNIWCVLLGSNGNIISKKVIGGSDNESVFDFDAVANGIVVVGYTYSNDIDVVGKNNPATNNADMWVANVSSAGTLVWAKCYGGSSSEFAHAIRKSSDGNLYIGGYTFSQNGDATGNPSSTSSAAWLIKTNATGTILWKRFYWGGGSGADIRNISETDDGGCYWIAQTNGTTGDFSGAKGEQDIWIGKVSSSGNLDWKKCIGGSDGDYLPPVGFDHARRHATNSDDMLFMGSGYSSDMDFECEGTDPDYKFFWAKIDNSGNYQIIHHKRNKDYDEDALFGIFLDATSYCFLMIRDNYSTNSRYLDIVRYTK